MEVWNVKHLNSPPITSFKAPLKVADVRFLSSSLKNAIDFFANQKQLSVEAALLSRTVYRFKMKFRSSKDFKAAEKLNHALRIYLQIQILRPLKIFLDSIPQEYKMNETYLPTKHMLDFVLVRLQSLGKLLVRIVETCKIICELMQQRLRLGHFWNLALIIYAISSRIYIISKTLLKYTCTLYSDLVPFSSKLSNIGRQWLPEGYVLPENLSQWLDIDWMDSERTVIEIEDDESAVSFLNLLEDSDDDVEIFDEYVLIRDEADSSLNLEMDNHNAAEASTEQHEDDGRLVGFNDDVDVGEVVTLSETESPNEEPKVLIPRKRKREKKKANKKKAKLMKRKEKKMLRLC